MLDQDDIQQLRRLMELRVKRDELSKAHDNAKKEYKEAELDLFEKLTNPETGNVRRIPPVDLGPPFGRVAFQARETIYGRIINEKEAREYFEQQGMGDVLTAPKFVKKRLNEIARDVDEQAAEPPPGFDWYKDRGITVTRQKGDDGDE